MDEDALRSMLNEVDANKNGRLEEDEFLQVEISTHFDNFLNLQKKFEVLIRFKPAAGLGYLVLCAIAIPSLILG